MGRPESFITPAAPRRDGARGVEPTQGIVFVQLCNVLDPRLAVALSSASNKLRTATQALLPQLKADHGAAELQGDARGEAGLLVEHIIHRGRPGIAGHAGLDAACARDAHLWERSAGAAGPDGVQRLAEGLGAGALPAVTTLAIMNMHVGDAGASALAAALGRGALPRLKILRLYDGIGDAELAGGPRAGLAAAARAGVVLEELDLEESPLGDEGIAALVGTTAVSRSAAADGCRANEAQGAEPQLHPGHRRRLRRPRLESGVLPALYLRLFLNPSLQAPRR